MESNRGALPKAVYRARSMAGNKYPGPLRGALGVDVFHRTNLMVANRAPGDTCGRISRSCIHHFSRLRSWLVFQIATREPHFGDDHGNPDVHPVLSLALGAWRPPCDF